MEKALENSFLLTLFQGDMSKVPTRGIIHLTVQKPGLEIPKPTMLAWENWTYSCVITGHLVVALQGTTEFKSGYHALILQEGHG